MAWNEPGDKKPRDPWGRDEKDKGNGGGDKQQPPELDKIFKDIKKQFSGLFGGGKSGGGKPNGDKSSKGGKPTWSSSQLLGMLLLGLVGVFVFSGFYQVPAGQKSVVLLYGQVNRVAGPGLHWYNPLLESLTLITLTDDSHYRLTGELPSADGDLVKVGVDVGYKVADPAAYVLATAAPVTLLQNLTLAQLRQLVGQTKMQDLLAQSPPELAARVQKKLEAALAPWHAGLAVTGVSITELALPDAVKSAHDSHDKAQSKAASELQDAQAYQQAQLLVAQGQAERMLTKAKAYQQKVVDYAEGETSRFNSLLATYEKAPRVTRDRLYLETMEKVFEQTSKVLVTDSKSGQQLALPLAELIRGVKAAPSTASEPDTTVTTKPAPPSKTEPTAVPSLYGSSASDSTNSKTGDAP